VDGDHSEDCIIEQPTIELFQNLGWETANAFIKHFVYRLKAIRL
jgi:hypothetical protein